MRKKRSVFILSIALALILSSGFQCLANSGPEKSWYKGNLHTHTTFSDGDTPPEGVIAWYKEHGYDFLALTDHNHITPPADYRDFQGDEFLLISANEISDRLGKTSLHLLALNVHDPRLAPTGGGTITEILQNNIRAIRKAGGVPVLAHPNFTWAFQDKEMLDLEDCRLFEVWNAHPAVNNLGGGGRPGTEEIWDRVLSAGKIYYGIGTDDMHRLASYPGKSWIMVRSSEFSIREILKSLETGDFYVSTGIELDESRIESDRIQLRIRPAGDARYRTWFIGRNGTVLKLDESNTPSYLFTGKEGYVRAKVVDSNGHMAFLQPCFPESVEFRHP